MSFDVSQLNIKDEDDVDWKNKLNQTETKYKDMREKFDRLRTDAKEGRYNRDSILEIENKL